MPNNPPRVQIIALKKCVAKKESIHGVAEVFHLIKFARHNAVAVHNHFFFYYQHDFADKFCRMVPHLFISMSTRNVLFAWDSFYGTNNPVICSVKLFEHELDITFSTSKHFISFIEQL